MKFISLRDLRGNSAGVWKDLPAEVERVIGCGDLVGGITRLLWLAPDHLHVYVESDGEKSIEAIIRKLKVSLKKAILANFPEIKKDLDKGNNLWDEAYFVETLG